MELSGRNERADCKSSVQQLSAPQRNPERSGRSDLNQLVGFFEPRHE